MEASMLEYETINDRTCKLRMKGRYRNITIISVQGKRKKKKKEFYECLEETYQDNSEVRFSNNNGRLQRKDRQKKKEYEKKATGKYSIHNISNENGNLLGQFATINGLKIKSKTFPHKSIHLGTWKVKAAP
jgi:hypothetical protein